MHKFITTILKTLALVFLISSIASEASAKTLGVNGLTAICKNEVLAAANPGLSEQAAEEAARHLNAGWQIPLIGGELKTNVWNACHDFVVSGGQMASATATIAPSASLAAPAAASVAVAHETAAVAAPAVAKESQQTALSIATLGTYPAGFAEASAAKPVVALPPPSSPVNNTHPTYGNGRMYQVAEVSDAWTWFTSLWLVRAIARLVVVIFIAAVIAVVVAAIGIVSWHEACYTRDPNEYDGLRPTVQILNWIRAWTRSITTARFKRPQVKSAHGDPANEVGEPPQHLYPIDERMSAAGFV